MLTVRNPGLLVHLNARTPSATHLQVVVFGVWAVEFVGLVFLVIGLFLKLEMVHSRLCLYFVGPVHFFDGISLELEMVHFKHRNP